jgi:hypothetical protein
MNLYACVSEEHGDNAGARATLRSEEVVQKPPSLHFL